jgi:arginyl-tRNA synthetase
VSSVLLDLLGEALVDAARKNGWDPPGGEDRIPIEVPRDPSHGDFATNLAMVLSKQVRKSPREVAEMLIASLPVGEQLIASADVAGPGFINFRLAPRALHDVLLEILRDGPAFGRSDAGRGLVAQVEYVSANPTGPMNVVNARAAAIGDALVRLLRATGHDAKSEFYVNDAGRQIELLGQSFQARYRERLGRPGTFPEEGYQGEYVTELVADFPADEAEAALADP